MKIASWNVNGIRAATRNGLLKWMAEERADVIAVQEIKARPEQLDEELRNPLKYHALWNPAAKPGYSGTAIFSKKEPIRVVTGMGIPEFDSEGRVLVAEYPSIVVVNAYFPNSQRDHARLPYKLKFCESILKFTQQYRRAGKNVVLCGDFNIAHREIDLTNPGPNKKNAGFLPEERAWMDQYLRAGYVDTFRHFVPDPGHYTWWSQRPGVRAKNIGWRLDYHVVNEEAADRLKAAAIRCDTRGSDHCPVIVQFKR